MKRKLEEILAEYKANVETAARDINTLPYNTRSAHQTAIRAAKDQVLVLRQEYDDVLFQNAYAVVAVGSTFKTDQFVITTREIGGVDYNFDAVYKTLATYVNATIGFTREFGPNQGYTMMQKLEQILQINGVDFQIKDPNITTTCICSTYTDVVDHIREVLTQTFGNVLTYLLVRNNLLTQALAIGHTKKALAVTFTGSSNGQDLIAVAPLLKDVQLLDVTDATIDSAYVISIFNKMNKKNKLKTNQAESHTSKENDTNE
jgi:hypothetical protein